MVTATSSIFRDSNTPSRPGPSRSAKPSLTIYVRPPSEPGSPPPAPPPRAATPDGKLLAILDAPLAPGETAMFGFQRKERELIAALNTLTVAESRALQPRLANPKEGDELANKFARLTIDRRARVLSFLADARRREALTRSSRVP
ncbi:MAG TPA: hypothetical protein VGM90_02620 [Kofleriaceae bacterium]|jgi:hypothetical protein